jgi:hypothetical protein
VVRAALVDARELIDVMYGPLWRALEGIGLAEFGFSVSVGRSEEVALQTRSACRHPSWHEGAAALYRFAGLGLTQEPAKDLLIMNIPFLSRLRHAKKGAKMVDSTMGGATSPQERSRLGRLVSQNVTAAWLAFITTIGFFSLIAALLLISWAGSGSPVPVGAAAAGAVSALTQGPFHDLLNTTVGIVGTAWATIISFYFGSSRGSQQKTETLSQVALAARPGSEQPSPGASRGNNIPG